MKLKPKTVLLIAPVALSFGLWIDQMIASERYAPARQHEIRIETVDQQKSGDQEEKSTLISKVVAFM
jgi:hypothetical protein